MNRRGFIAGLLSTAVPLPPIDTFAAKLVAAANTQNMIVAASINQSMIVPGSINAANIAADRITIGLIDIVSDLPVDNNFIGRMCFNTATNYIYRFTGSKWIEANAISCTEDEA